MKIKPINAYRSMSPAVKASIWFTICNFLQRGTALITVPIFTRLLTTEEYGICNIYFAWFDIFILITSLKIQFEGLNNGLIRYEKDKDAYTSAILGLIMVMTSISAAVYAVFHNWVDRITGLSSTIMVLMFIQLLFNPPLMLWTNRERFDFNYHLPVIVTLVSTVLNPVIAIVAVMNTEYKAEARIIAVVVIQAFFGIVLSVVLFRKGRTFFKKEYWVFALKFNLPLFFYYISQMILNQSDRIMINYFEGSGKAAIYSVAYSAATIMQLLVSAVNASFNPWMYKKLKAGKYREIKYTVTVLCLLVAGATLALSAFAPDLIHILATKEYNQAIWIIPPVSASVFFIFIYMLFANVEMYYNANKGISIISIICSAANLILNAIFIPIYGYMAAGWTTLACYMLLTFLHYILMKKACRRQKLQENMFPEKILLLIIAGVILATFMMLGMYKMSYFRYIILTLEFMVLLCLRKRLFGVLKQMRKGAKEDDE
ncbi:MAG: lipopolysaccharide biosynthesis protein [Dorea sp.]